jgi:hypothetical protein
VALRAPLLAIDGRQPAAREFLDHSRVFTDDNGRVMYYRSHAKGLEENALALSVARFAYPPVPDDPCTGVPVADTLRYKLEKRLNDWFARIYDDRGSTRRRAG